MNMDAKAASRVPPAPMWSSAVTFEQYDTPELKTVIAYLGPDKVVWFKDPDGKIQSLVQENV